jgi:large conductance mechanosensitive channel
MVVLYKKPKDLFYITRASCALLKGQLLLHNVGLFINHWIGHIVSILKEFREFADKGNVLDLAVAVIIGGAFSGIVKSLVDDVIMPLVGRLIGSLDFSNLFLALAEVPAGVAPTLEAVRKAGVPVLAYGSFISVVINFAIMAFIIFMMVRQVNKLVGVLKTEEAAAAEPAATPEDVLLLREIRDALKK